MSSLFLLAALLVAPEIASATGLASQTMKICEEATRLEDSVAELRKIGWKTAAKSQSDRFIAVFADGLTASTAGSMAAKIDWPKSLPRSLEFAEMAFEASLVGRLQTRVFLSDHEQQAALMLIEEPDVPLGFRCLYSGPADTEIRDLLQTLSKMDEIAGLAQATPEVQIGTIDIANTQRSVSVQIALFVQPMQAQFGREAHVEMGFSLINSPTR